MTAWCFCHLRTSPACHHALRHRWNHLVIRYHKIGTWLRAPRRLTNSPLQGFQSPWNLRICHERSEGRTDIRGEGSCKLIPIRGTDSRQPEAGLEALVHRGEGWQSARRNRFTAIRSKGRDVDRCSYLWIVARLRYDYATIGVANQNHIPLRGCDRSPGRSYVIR